VAELEADILARTADVTPTAEQLADLVKLLRELEQGFSIPASPASTPPGPENFDPNNSPYPSLERSTK